MILKRLTLQNFRLMESLSLDFGRRLTLLIGANGSGKTSILDGIAIGLGAALTHLPDVSGQTFKKYGDIRQTNNQLAPFARVFIETGSGLKWDRIQRRDKSASTSQNIPKGYGLKELEHYLNQQVIDPSNDGVGFDLPMFAYYGVSRALLNVPLSRKGFPKKHRRFEALAGALQANSRFKSAFIWFYNQENEEHRLQKQHKSFEYTLHELDVVRQAITRMFSDITEPHITLNPLSLVVTHGGECLNIAQLSDGYKTLLGLVIDLSSRMAMANPHLNDPLAAESIVMIDELDLHLHPSWQQRVMGDLLQTFTGSQFIVTTHSPFIVESMNNHLKRNQISDDEILDDDIKRLPPLSASDVSAYLMTDSGHLSLLNQELMLLDDQLLEYFNHIGHLYERMRDIEWERKN